MEAQIWCEVMCQNCMRLLRASRYYRNSKDIASIKAAAKNWIYDDEFGNLCPECQKKN